MLNKILFLITVLTLNCVAFNTSAQFTPNNLIGLNVWLAADSTMVQSGTLVQQWNDISGNNNHFVSPNPSFYPNKVNTSLTNNKPYVDFDGTDKLESVNSFSLNNATIFIVASQNTGDLSFGRLMDHGYNTGFWIGNGGSGAAGGGYYEGAPPYGNFESVAIDTPHILTLVRTGAVTEYFKNTLPFGTPTKTTVASATVNNKIVLGASIINGDFGIKSIYEVLIYNRALSATEVNSVNGYLQAKYGQPLSLGPDVTTTNFCPTTLSAPSGFTNYLWSTGETTSTISVNPNAEYWLQAEDIFGFVTTDTIQVNHPTIQAPPANGICAGSTVLWNTNLSTSAYSFLWNTAATTPSIVITTPGDYSVQVTDSLGCIAHSDTTTFSIDNYATTASLGNDTNLCSGNAIGLVVGAASTTNYLWQNSATTSTVPILVTGTYSAQTTNINGCVAFDTINVTISGTAPLASFVIQDGCKLTPISFTDQSSGVDPIVSWDWQFGDGQNSAIQNASHSYLNSGVFPVQLSIVSMSGCTASFSTDITIFETPTADFQFTGNCSGTIFNFNNSSQAGDTSIASFLWDYGQPSLGAANTSTLPSPTVTFPTAGAYSATFLVTDNHGCADDSVFQLTVDPTPEPSFSYNEACTGDTVHFVNTTVLASSASFLWNFGDGTTSTSENPSKLYFGYGTRTISLQIITSEGCTNDIVQNIDIHPYPSVSIDITGQCSETFAQFKDNSIITIGSIGSVSWVMNQTDTLIGDSVNYFVPNNNQQQVDVYVQSNFGCETVSTQFFTPFQLLNASFQLNSPVIATGIPIDFQNNSFGGDTYVWDFGDGNNSTHVDPTNTFSANLTDSTISVELIVHTNSGCIDTVVQSFTLVESQLDLALTNLFYQASGDVATVGVELTNNGSVPIDSATLSLETENGFQFHEVWTGMLQPGETVIHVFLQEPIYDVSDGGKQAFYCAEGHPILQGIDEFDLTNNRFCKSIEGSNTILMTVYPNPVVNDLNIELLVTENSEVSLELVDYRGSRVKSIFNKVSFQPGLFDYEISMRNINAGIYFIRMENNGELKIQRILVTH